MTMKKTMPTPTMASPNSESNRFYRTRLIVVALVETSLSLRSEVALNQSFLFLSNSLNVFVNKVLEAGILQDFVRCLCDVLGSCDSVLKIKQSTHHPMVLYKVNKENKLFLTKSKAGQDALLWSMQQLSHNDLESDGENEDDDDDESSDDEKRHSRIHVEWRIGGTLALQPNPKTTTSYLRNNTCFRLLPA